MSAHAYTEELLVELPAFNLLGDLGWELMSALPLPEPLPSGRQITIDPSGLLGRETPAEVVLFTRLRSALEKLNPHLPPESIEAAIGEIIRDRSAMEPAAANRELYELLKDGIRVSVPDTEPSPQPSPKGRGSDNSAAHPGSQSSAPRPSPGLRQSPHPPSGHPLPSDGRGASPAPAGEGQGRGAGQRLERVRVIDWNEPANNDFLAVRQISFIGPLYTCRPDIICFVNGLPLVVLEFKKPGVPARQAFDDNLTSYKHP